ncbi:unnamed protein product [Parnassius apollo]|uniref:(apollo) hypothetical protein n=1 Tax=Parnassius apollo TaxID=110799 RepID=A0A8S3WNM1_PARAO|nr:unnamed protein product [Parnassius apollo]
MKTGDEPLPSTKQPWGDSDTSNITSKTEQKPEVTSATPETMGSPVTIETTVTIETPVTIHANGLKTTDTNRATQAKKKYRLITMF